MLYSEPSFAIYNDEENINGGELVRSVTIGDEIEALGNEEFSFSRKPMGFIQENDDDDDDDDDDDEDDENGNKKIQELNLSGGVEVNDLQYQRMMITGEEEPSSLLSLKSYAQFLQSQGDLAGAEECYFCATLAYPNDGEILMQYAKLVWEVHRDREKALSYFERAASVSSADSNALGEYASFLWEIGESEEEDGSPETETWIEGSGTEADLQSASAEERETPVEVDGGGVATSVTDSAARAPDGGNVEEYYKRAVEENPSNPVFLRNYAEFLCNVSMLYAFNVMFIKNLIYDDQSGHYLVDTKSKGDMKAAEEYYSKAILADPSDGETISQYAILVWELHRDKDKASSNFERSVQASPESSDVLAAYARFLWETEEDEDDQDEIIMEKSDGMSSPGAVMSTTV